MQSSPPSSLPTPKHLPTTDIEAWSMEKVPDGVVAGRWWWQVKVVVGEQEIGFSEDYRGKAKEAGR